MESSSTKKPHYYHAKLRRDGMIKDKFIVNTEFGLCEYCMQVVSDKLVGMGILQRFVLLVSLIDSVAVYKKINMSCYKDRSE